MGLHLRNLPDSLYSPSLCASEHPACMAFQCNQKGKIYKNLPENNETSYFS